MKLTTPLEKLMKLAKQNLNTHACRDSNPCELVDETKRSPMQHASMRSARFNVYKNKKQRERGNLSQNNPSMPALPDGPLTGLDLKFDPNNERGNDVLITYGLPF